MAGSQHGEGAGVAHVAHTHRAARVPAQMLRRMRRVGNGWIEVPSIAQPASTALELEADEPCLLQQPVQDAHVRAHAHTFAVEGSWTSEAQDTMRHTRRAGSSAGDACAAQGSAGSPRLEQHEASTPSAELEVGAAQCPSRQDVTDFGVRQTDRQNLDLQDGQTDEPAGRGGTQGSPTKVGAKVTGLQEGGPRGMGTSARNERTRVRRLFQRDTLGTDADGGGERVARDMFSRAVSGVDGAWRATRAAADATVRRARRFFFRDAG